MIRADVIAPEPHIRMYPHFMPLYQANHTVLFRRPLVCSAKTTCMSMLTGSQENEKVKMSESRIGSRREVDR